jgi:hypothetical protein
MPIPLFLVERLKAAHINGDQLADVFLRLARASDVRGENLCAINLQFVKDGDGLIPGDLIPTISFSLERQQNRQEIMPVKAATDIDDKDPYPEE